MTLKADVLICGSGIVGLVIAYKLLQSGYENIIIIEKENRIGLHASGRNSGVLHAGIYYAPDSLKAQFCLRGNRLMKEYCRANNLPLIETGKVIVTKTEKELTVLDELYERAVKNGANVKLIDCKELEEIEPYAKTCERALYSFDTAVIDPKEVILDLYQKLLSSGKVQIMTKEKYMSLKGSNTAITDSGKQISFDLFINAAGAYSDKVAHSFGIGLNYRLIPFKGIYKKLKKGKSFLVKGNIYPVPDIRNPFLGVHLTKSIDGDVYIGPTAIPALGRENYGILKGLDWEVFEILYRDIFLFISNAQFRNVALTEPKKYLFKYFFKDVKALLKEIEEKDIEESDKVGIRPQLVDWNKKKLVLDFMVIQDGISIHILNAISPAFTSSFAFAEFVIEKYIKKTQSERDIL